MKRLEKILLGQWFDNPATGLTAKVVGALTSALSLITQPIASNRLSQRQVNIAMRRQNQSIEAVKPLVMVIGNLIVGGAGKTPLVIALSEYCKTLGLSPGIVTGGYGSLAAQTPAAVDPSSTAQHVGDEAVLLYRTTQNPVAAGRDRIAAIDLLKRQHVELDVVICDDGLQHKPLQGDIEIMVFDERLLGNGRLLPAGPLREPLARLALVDFIVVPKGHRSAFIQRVTELATKDNVHVSMPQVFEQSWQLLGFVPLNKYLLLSAISRSELLAAITSIDAAKQDWIRSPSTTHLVAGIGNPQKFYASLQSVGIEGIPVGISDHQAIGIDWLREHLGNRALMTEKDAVKCTSYPSELLENCWVAIGQTVPEPAMFSAIDEHPALKRCYTAARTAQHN